MRKSVIYVGLDVHKSSIVIAAATGQGEATIVGTILNDWMTLLRELDRMGSRARLRVCYEAGPTGYGLARRLNASGICCLVIAPSRIPREPGQRVKTDRRDARTLSRLLRAGLLTEVKIPEEEREAMRDLERARDDAKNVQRTVRHQLDKFLLRHGRSWSRTKWTQLHWSWIKQQAFPAEALRRVLADSMRAVEEATARVKRLENDIEELVETWSLAPLVRALQALRGMRLLSAVIVAAELGDITQFSSPRNAMGFLGQVPSEDSSGERRHRGRITRTGNGHVRRILTEAAWNYRFHPRPSRAIRQRRASLPREIVAIAEKAEQRLSRRYQHLINKGKSSPKAATAVARELTGFVWAIAQEVRKCEAA
jgi:transposase